MGVHFQGTTVDASAPDIEGGIHDARFDGVVAKVIKDSPFDPNVFEWKFTIFEDGAVVYSEGEPLEVTGLTSRSMNLKSKTVPRVVQYLKAILTTEEYATFEAGETQLDAEALEGRMVQVILKIKDTGWPTVDNVLPVKRSGKVKAKAAAEE